MVRASGSLQAAVVWRLGPAPRVELLADPRTAAALCARRTVSRGHAVHALQSTAVLGFARAVRCGGGDHLRRPAGAQMDVKIASVTTMIALALWSMPVFASGHGPVFGAATPTLGKGGWQFDQAWMARTTEEAVEQTLRSMISFGVTER